MSPRVFATFAWLLAILWLPATVHCAAENSGWLELAGCCADEAMPVAASDHCEADHCTELEAGFPREELNTAVFNAPVAALLAIFRPALVTEPAAASGITPWLAAPPEIGGLWRTTQRVVAAAQAP